MPFNSFLNFPILSDFKMRNVIIMYCTDLLYRDNKNRKQSVQ